GSQLLGFPGSSLGLASSFLLSLGSSALGGLLGLGGFATGFLGSGFLGFGSGFLRLGSSALGSGFGFLGSGFGGFLRLGQGGLGFFHAFLGLLGFFEGGLRGLHFGSCFLLGCSGYLHSINFRFGGLAGYLLLGFRFGFCHFRFLLSYRGFLTPLAR